mgnify:CR=1 FL=1
MYRAREQKDILREMQDWSNTPTSKIEGTFEYDMLAANSVGPMEKVQSTIICQKNSLSTSYVQNICNYIKTEQDF